MIQMPPSVEGSGNTIMGGKVDETATNDEDHVQKKNCKASKFEIKMNTQEEDKE